MRFFSQSPPATRAMTPHRISPLSFDRVPIIPVKYVEVPQTPRPINPASPYMVDHDFPANSFRQKYAVAALAPTHISAIKLSANRNHPDILTKYPPKMIT